MAGPPADARASVDAPGAHFYIVQRGPARRRGGVSAGAAQALARRPGNRAPVRARILLSPETSGDDAAGRVGHERAAADRQASLAPDVDAAAAGGGRLRAGG